MTKLKTKIIEAVQNNSITMIPKWKFVLYSVFGILGIIFSFLIAIFIFSLVLFLLSTYGFLYMPFFEFVSTLHTLSAIPLLLLLCTIGLLIVIEIVSRYHSFSFRQPLSVTLLLITSIVTIISFFISESGIHDYVHEYAKKHRISMMEKMYARPKPFRPIDKRMDVLRGEVIQVASSSVSIKLFDGTIVVAYATTSNEGNIFSSLEGKEVMVLGVFNGEKFEIVKMKNNKKPPFRKDGRRDMPMYQAEGLPHEAQ